jgi:O-antigen ligase
MTEKQKSKKYWVIQLCYFLFFALCISVPSGYSYASAVLLFLSLPLLINKKNYFVLDQNSKYLLLAFLVYVLIQGISIIWDGGAIKEFDRPSRALMGIAILLLCLRYPPRFLWLMNGIATGAIAAGIRALWDRQIIGYGRAFEWMMPIQGGDISMSLGLLSLCGVMWAIKTSSYRHLFYFSIASIMGLLGSILSGSRGGWVLFPVILFVGYRIFRDWFSTRIKWSMALALCLLISFCLIPQSGVPQRISQAKNDVQLYFTGENKVTSLGHRFEIWKSSIDSFIKKPVFGWGNHGVRLSQEQQYKSGLIAKAAYDFNGHAHNQFFDEMAKRGIIGLSALLALFLFPLTIFKRQLANATLVEDKTLAACGVILVLSTIDYCLSQAFLNHNSGIVFYCLSVILIYSSSKTTNFMERK